ncbi:desmoplakin-like [Xyrauchen texanus]|uniref:desmoplakin-like n=1 Tax=Xyrauchen texanus TaxID=154827 RepID=UPI0022423C68|nr:desmoplakin-like [Xyrauchen texanus]
MSMYGSQRVLNKTVRRTGSRSDENAAAYPYARSEMVVQRGDNGYVQEYIESGFSHNVSRQSTSAGQVSNMSSIQKQISLLQSQCQDFLDTAEYCLQNGKDSRALAEADKYLASAFEACEQLKGFALDLTQQNMPTENITRSLNIFMDQYRELSAALNGPQQQKVTSRSIRRSVSREEPNRLFIEAMGWITQQKRLIETSNWAEDITTIEQQIANHTAFQSSIQRSVVVDRARADLMRAKDQNADVNKSNLNKMEQEWDSLQKASYQRGDQLQELRTIVEEISNQIMWVNDREEEELMFDWGDKNIDTYIPKKEESFSKLMRELELKEMDLNVLKGKVDNLLKNTHPASDKIQAYMETLQTQWSWLLQITKCIHVHLKENAKYSQFFKETTDMYVKLQKEHDNIRKNFSVNKSTPLHSLLELAQGLERERERLTEQKEMVQQLVMKSKNIIRLKPRNSEEKITSHVAVRALCDFRQDEKVIRKGDEGILKDMCVHIWQVLVLRIEMQMLCLPADVCSAVYVLCLNVNCLFTGRNSQYYEAILTVWNQLYINIKSMISWQYCLLDINRTNSLTITMLAKMGPEESMSIIKSLEMHFQEFMKQAQGSELFGVEDLKTIESQYSGAQKHFGKLSTELPTYTAQGEGSEYSAAVSVKLLNEFHALRFKLDRAESSLVSFLYIAIAENAPDECARHIINTQVFQKDVVSLKGEFIKLRDSIQAELKDAKDTDKAKYLNGQLDFINQSLVNLDKYTGTHLQRLNSLKSLLKTVMSAEDVVKVYEARLVEKETASMDPEEIQKYQNVLKEMRSDLEQKQEVLNSLEAELSNVHQFNDQADQGRYKCIINFSQYAEHVNQLTDRWKRIQIQIKSRLVDLDAYLPQLQRYLNSSSSLSGWIDETQRHIDAQQSTKTDDANVYTQLLNQQKALNSDIKAKRELVETVQEDGEACIQAIKNYELELASYGAGLETLLSIPIKRSVLQSPSSAISEEVSSLNGHYLELLTRSNDYYKLLVVSSKNIKELEMRNTQIELLKEELEELRDTIKDHNATNVSLQEALIKYKQELSDSQQQLLSLEEVKRSQTLKCMATQETLDSTENRLQELMEQIRHLKIHLEDVERKNKIVEDRYTFLQEEYDETMRKKLKELEHASWAKMELEKTVSDRTREVEHLRRELEQEAQRVKEAQAELAKIRRRIQRYEGATETTPSLPQPRRGTEKEPRRGGKETIAQLQSRIQELQEELKRLECEKEKQRQVAEEEAGKCRRTEMELEKSSQAMREYTSTITTLRKSQEETSLEAKQADQELKKLQGTLDRTLKEHKASSQSLATMKTEMNTLRLQLKEEQGRVHDANKRYEALRCNMEEKTIALNANTVETERLQKMSETLTKEHLRLEEELRGVRLEREELLKGKKHEDQEMAEQIAALKKQLDASQRAGAEHDRLIRQLSQEREKLQQETENVQKQASETSSVIQISQSQFTELQQERDALIKKIKTMEQDMMRLKKLEEELTHIKLSLESELQMKSQLQEEKDRINKEFTQWKIKCDTHEDKIQQHNSDCSAMASHFNSVKSEMERLRALLSETEEHYRMHLQTLEQERTEMPVLRSSQQNPDGASKYNQTDQPDSSSLVFDGVRKKVTAQQLLDCGVIDKVTFEQLIKGEQTVQDVAVDIRLNLKGTGAIAGLVGGPKGKITFTEAKKQQLLSDESAKMLLEAQAATGYMIDPRANVKMTVEEACQNGLVDEADKKQLLIAESACVGFRDPKTAKLLSASQAMRKGIINRDTALRLLQAQEAAGGILDPILSIYLSKDTAMDRDLIDDDLYQALNAAPACYIDPVTGLHANYVTLKKQCKADLTTSLLMLPAPEKPMTVQGLRAEVSVSDLVDAKLLEPSDVESLREGKITSQDIEHRLRAYLRGSTCIAGVYDEANDCTLTIYQAMKNGLLQPGTTLELLEAQAASGFMINPINNEYYTVEEACKKGLAGVEFKDKLLSAERAVSGYQDPGTNKIISLFEAIERGIIEKGHGIRLLEAQIASGGIIDPKHSHRIDVDVAYQRGYFGEKMNQILKDEGDETKGFFDPNTEDNLTYLQLKSRCITDKKTGLVLLPLKDKKKSKQKNTMRKRRVLIVDPESNKEMTVREAYEKKLIDHQTFLELSQQECEWEETIITAPDGSTRTAIMDVQTGIHYDLKELLDKGVIGQDIFDKYRSGDITVTQLADMITNKAKNLNKPLSSTASSSSFTSQTALTSQTIKSETTQTVQSVSTRQDLSSTNSAKHISNMSVKLAPVETIEQQNPVGAIFYTEMLEKISVCDALKRGILDSFTAQRLLEAQACTGGVVNPENGRRMSIQEATRLGVLDEEMANRLKPAQKAYIGFEDVKTKRKMSAAEAVKAKWLSYEAGQRFLEFQYLTGGLFDPELGCRRTLEEALQLGWLDTRGAQRLQDTRNHPKMLTCPKTKLRISYKEALEGCMNEENTGVRMLPATTVSSHEIGSPNNLSNSVSAPESRSRSQNGSHRGSVDYGLSPSSSTRSSSFSYNRTSFSSGSLS